MPNIKKTNVIRVNDVQNSDIRKRMLKWFEGRDKVSPLKKNHQKSN